MISTATRIIVGVSLLIAIGAADLWRHGRAGRRWREYLFLFCATGLAMVYGALNDQITSAISWEYFYYAKEIDKILGSDTPPDRAAMRWQAAIVGMKATWSVGLMLGAGLLIANNPRRDRPPMAYARLMTMFMLIFIVTALGAVIGGIAGWNGRLTWCDSDFQEMVATNLWHPYHFMACWGAHLGAYIGGMVGGTVAIIAVVNRKKVAAEIRVPLAQPLRGG